MMALLSNNAIDEVIGSQATPAQTLEWSQYFNGIDGLCREVKGWEEGTSLLKSRLSMGDLCIRSDA